MEIVEVLAASVLEALLDISVSP